MSTTETRIPEQRADFSLTELRTEATAIPDECDGPLVTCPWSHKRASAALMFCSQWGNRNASRGHVRLSAIGNDYFTPKIF